MFLFNIKQQQAPQTSKCQNNVNAYTSNKLQTFQKWGGEKMRTCCCFKWKVIYKALPGNIYVTVQDLMLRTHVIIGCTQ